MSGNDRLLECIKKDIIDGVELEKHTQEKVLALIERRFKAEGQLSPSVIIVWQLEDIQTEKPDWSHEQCVQFLEDEHKSISNQSIELGWETIQTLMEMKELESVRG